MPHGLGPDDGVGQIVTIDGVRYRGTRDGLEPLNAEEAAKAAQRARDSEEIRRSMSAPELSTNPTGNPYK